MKLSLNSPSVEFESVIYSRDALGAITVHGFTVTLENTLTIGARLLYLVNRAAYNEIHAMAVDAAAKMSQERATVDISWN